MWRTRARLEFYATNGERLSRTAVEVRRSEERLRAAMQAAVEEEHRLAEDIGTIEAKRGELSDLIGAFEDHIEGGVCPACGHEHGSRRELLERISAQMGRDVATDERVSRDAVRTRIEELRSSIEEVEGRGKLITHQRAELAEERDMVVAEVEAFRGLMEHFAVPIGSDADVARKDIAAKYALLERQSEEWTAEAARAAEESETLTREWQATTTVDPTGAGRG